MAANPLTQLTPDHSENGSTHRSISRTWGEAMKDLRDWYRYLEGISAGSSPPKSVATSTQPTLKRRRGDEVDSGPARVERGELRRVQTDGRSRPQTPLLRQEPLPMDLGSPATAPRRSGRRPLTETREEIVRRLLDPELTLHEAAALLHLSKATLRRYTDQGKLPCTRTAGGQRRFRLSEVLALLDRRPPGVEATR